MGDGLLVMGEKLKRKMFKIVQKSKWSKNRSNANVVGFVDDSLVMVGDYRYWEEITDEWNGGYSDIEGFGHERL